jgi:GntR family transcriptional regulator/MocR family aminotransferase
VLRNDADAQRDCEEHGGRFPDGFPIAELVDRAARKRVRVEPLTPCYAESASAPPGLILGYANLTE